MAVQYQGYKQTGSQKAQATANLAQTMSLLALNSQELTQKIESALAENPALELVDGRFCPKCHRQLKGSSPCPVCSFKESQIAGDDEPIVFLNSPSDNIGPRSGQSAELSEDFPTADKEDLPTYVLRQIGADLAADELEIAAHLLTAINDDGLLEAKLDDIAQFFFRPLSDIEAVADLIQRSDPLGVGSESSQAALLVQLEVLMNDEDEDYPLYRQAVMGGMEKLGKRRQGELAKELNISIEKAKEITQYIVDNLNPFPARAYWGSKRNLTNDAPTTLQKPDIIIGHQQDDQRLVVEVMWPLFGLLRVNPLFKEAVKNAPEAKADDWQIDLEQANLLIKCLAQRNHTIVRLMQIITILQREYILNGDAHMKPITRAKLAIELGVHESTISRAVAGKSVQLPSGKIVLLSQFFDRSLHVRTALKTLIAQETKPLSDTKIVKLLAKEGHEIARRTVAKYRNMEGILPAHMRKTLLAKV
jgi:RNA polymerase sigma-54 factor